MRHVLTQLPATVSTQLPPLSKNALKKRKRAELAKERRRMQREARKQRRKERKDAGLPVSSRKRKRVPEIPKEYWATAPVVVFDLDFDADMTERVS